MATLEQQFNWLKEILEEKPERFADYYKDDIANYLDIEQIDSLDLENSLGSKFDDFNKCQDKEAVRAFISRITGYVVMKAQIEEIIEDYLS